MIRQHQISLQVSPHLFLDANRKLVVSVEVLPLADLTARGWTPVLIYGVCCSLTKLKAMRLVASDEPIALIDAAMQMWREDRWLKGLPDEVAVCPELQGSAKLQAALADLRIAVTLGNRKSYAINRRLIGNDFHGPASYGKTAATNLVQANANARESLGFILGDLRFASPAGRGTRATWEAMTYRQPPEAQSQHPLDWTYGPWVEIAFANAIGLPTGARLKQTRSGGSYVVQQRSPSPSSKIGFELSDLVAAWPGRYPGLAREIGIPESRLRAYVRGRDHALDWRETAILHTTLALEFSDDGYLDPSGPFLLMPLTPSAADKAWTAVSHGGDLQFAFEVVPQQHTGHHPTWHIVMGQAYGGGLCILLIPREGEPGQPLPERWCKKMINLSGEQFPCPDQDFQDLCNLLPALIAGASPAGIPRAVLLAGIERKWVRTLSEMTNDASWR